METADQRGQGRPLEEQGADRHREGDGLDEGATGKILASVRAERDGGGGGDRDHAPHPRPGDHDGLGHCHRLEVSSRGPAAVASGRCRALESLPEAFAAGSAFLESSLLQGTLGVERKDERRPHQHHEQQDDAGKGEDEPHGESGVDDIPHHKSQLQSHVGEDEGLEEHIERRPDLLLLQPSLIPHPVVRATDDEGSKNHGKNPGGFELLGNEVGGEWQHNPEHRLEPGVAQIAAQDVRQYPQCYAKEGADDRRVGEEKHRIGEQGVGASDRGDRDREQGEGGSVVHEALTGEDVHHPARQAEFVADGGRSDGIRGSHHRAQQNGRAQCESRHDRGGNETDRDRGDDHEAYPEAEDRAEIAQKAKHREVERRRVEKRGQNNAEDEFTRHFQARYTGDEGDCEAHDHDDQGGLQPLALGESGDTDCPQQHNEEQHDVHGPTVVRPRAATRRGWMWHG